MFVGRQVEQNAKEEVQQYNEVDDNFYILYLRGLINFQYFLRFLYENFTSLNEAMWEWSAFKFVVDVINSNWHEGFHGDFLEN